MTEREALEEAVRLYDSFGLLAGKDATNHLAVWRWANGARAALAATPAIRDEDKEYADTMRSVAQLLRADSVSKAALDTKIAALAERLWRVHPKEIQDLGITRQQYYEREIRSLFDAATPGGEPVAWRWRHVNSPSMDWNYKHEPIGNHNEYLEVEPLYAAQPASPLPAVDWEATKINPQPEYDALHAFDQENNLEPSSVVAERIAAKYGFDDKNPIVDDIHYAIEDALELGQRRGRLVPAAQPASPLRGRETFDAWFNSHFLDPDGGSNHLPDWLKDDLRSAWNAALAAPPEQPAADPESETKP